MELPEVIFLLRSSTADFHLGETNNLAASSKRADVIMRCIMAAVNRNGIRDPRFGCWVFFPFLQNKKHQNSILFDKKSFLPINVHNEISLFTFLKPLILKEIQISDKDYDREVNNIIIYNKDLDFAIQFLKQCGYFFVILEENGENFEKSQVNKSLSMNKKVYIIGDQIGNSEKIIQIIKKIDAPYGIFSLGPVSYLSSQCIKIISIKETLN